MGPGEILGILGESGGGKTTLARVLAGALRQKGPGGWDLRVTGGEAAVRGVPLRRLSRRGRRALDFSVGFLRQDAATRLTRTRTVADLILEPVYARSRPLARAAGDDRVGRLLIAVGLPLEAAWQYPYELSAGQQQRVAIARSLVLGPNVLIADEPTAGVDATVRDAVLGVIRELQRDPGFAALLVTHDLGVLRALEANVAVLHEGEIVGYGGVDEVFASPAHPFVARLKEALDLVELPDLDSNQEPAG
nr:ATP-binding cassette domain-containing protein [Gryllotalpicola sp.]